jgi:hypothetical protein
MKVCSDELLSLAQTYRRSGYKVSGDVPGARSITFRKGQEKGHLQCLPDTVDPRGPKGK